jgi:hypothetical protein
MMANKRESKHNSEPVQLSLRELFKEFGQPGFFLCPHRSRLGIWVFKWVWAAPILVLILILVYMNQSPSYPNFLDYVDDAFNRAIGQSSHFTPYAQVLVDTIGNVVSKFFVEIFVVLVLLSIALFLRIIVNLCYKVPKVLFRAVESGRLQPPAQIGGSSEGSDRKESSFFQYQMYLLRLWFRRTPGNYRYFVDDLKNTMSSPMILVYSLLWFFVVYKILQFSSWDPIRDGIGPYLVGEGRVVIPAGLLAVYFISTAFWVIFVIARYIQMLPDFFRIDVQFKHNDGSGGWGEIGGVVMQIAGMCLVLLVFFSIALIYVINLPISGKDSINSTIWVIYIFGGIGIPVLIVLINIAFFVPIWGIHKAMLAAKTDFQNDAIKTLGKFEAELKELLQTENPSAAEIEEIEKKIDAAQLIYPQGLRLNTWPFSTNVFIAFLSTQIIPVISVIAAITSLVNRE